MKIAKAMERVKRNNAEIERMPPDPLPNGRTGGPLVVERIADDEPKERALARAALRPTIGGASTIHGLAKPTMGDLHFMSLVDELQIYAQAAKKGDLGRTEGMLMVQAHTLDALFNELTRRAIANFDEYLNSGELYLRLALKAQSQGRSTIETLAEMKNPSQVAFVKQANIANGPQQVNNGARGEASRAENFENQPSKLLEQTDGERLDGGTPGATTGANTSLEAVGAVNGAENDGR